MGPFRTLVLIDHVIEEKSYFWESIIHYHSTRDLSSGVWGATMLYVTWNSQRTLPLRSLQPLQDLFLIVWRMVSAFLPESRPLLSAQTPIRKWVLLPKGILPHPPSSAEQWNSTLKEEVEAKNRKGSYAWPQGEAANVSGRALTEATLLGAPGRATAQRIMGGVPPETGQTWSPLKKMPWEPSPSGDGGWGGGPSRPRPTGYQSLW